VNRILPVLIVLCFGVATSRAADVAGVVKSSTAKYATVTTNSKTVPKPGTKAEIYFKVPGTDIDVSVANGHVYEITGANIMVQIDKATATVAKNQLVRFSGQAPNQAVTPPPPSVSSPSPAKQSTPPASGGLKQQLLGTWQGPSHRTTYFADGTCLIDPKPGVNQPRAHWRIVRDELVIALPQGTIRVLKITSFNPREMIVRNEQDATARVTRVFEAPKSP
jgi:hypothetical protein